MLKWTFRRDEKDRPPLNTNVSVPFSLGSDPSVDVRDQQVGAAYFPKDEACRNVLHTGDWSKGSSLCGEEVAIAADFPDVGRRYLEILGAHQNYGQALAFSGHPDSALAQFQEAIKLAQLYLKPTDVEYGEPFYWRAFVEHVQGNPKAAEQDYSTAEETYRQAQQHLPSMRGIYGKSLAHVLAYHAVLKDQMGDPVAARELRRQAVSEDPMVDLGPSARKDK